MAHWRKLLNNEYLGSWDLEGGKEPVVTIEKVKGVKLKSHQGDDQQAAKITFEGIGKPLIAKATVLKSIAAMYGNDTDGWVGKQIQLCVAMVPAFGEVVEAIRVKPTVPK